MNKQINLVINGKGGVGKSFFATNFVQYLKDCGIAKGYPFLRCRWRDDRKISGRCTCAWAIMFQRHENID